MPVTLYWLQAGGCGGDSVSLLGAECPDLIEACKHMDIRILRHPSLSADSIEEQRRTLRELTEGCTPLDFLCLEGALVRGPSGAGTYDRWDGQPKKSIFQALARRARYVLAVGTCAAFGGIGSENEIDACGAQFHREKPGGMLGTDFVAASGYPVINLPGCPCHSEVLLGTLAQLISGQTLALNGWNAPSDWYDILVHQGCTRNEYHEYRVEDAHFGEKGCLFFHLGCHGPLAYGPCNKLLWNRRSSKTRVGVPCFGCTRPDFPQPYPFFQTRNIEGIPIQLPDGVDRAHYLAYKGMAAAAAPARLIQRKNRV